MKTHKDRVLWSALSEEQKQSIFDSYEVAQEQAGVFEISFEEYVTDNIDLHAVINNLNDSDILAIGLDGPRQ